MKHAAELTFPKSHNQEQTDNSRACPSKRAHYSDVLVPSKMWNGVSPRALAVYVAMCSLAGRTRLFTWSREWLSERMMRPNGSHYSVDAISDAWKELEGAGYLRLNRNAYRNLKTGKRAPKCWVHTFKGFSPWNVRRLQQRMEARHKEASKPSSTMVPF